MKLSREDLISMGRDPDTGKRLDDEPDPPATKPTSHSLEQHLGWELTDDRVEFHLNGRPSGWKRRIDVGKGRAFMPTDVTQAEARVYEASLAARPSDWRLDGWYKLELTWTYPDMRFADVSNLLKLVEDGINGDEGADGSLWHDDRQVVGVTDMERLVRRDCDGYTRVTVIRVEPIDHEGSL